MDGDFFFHKSFSNLTLAMFHQLSDLLYIFPVDMTKCLLTLSQREKKNNDGQDDH